MAQSLEIRFVADRMLGRLARMLRLLGYDTHYSPDLIAAQILEIAEREGRWVLTRGQAEKRYPGLRSVWRLKSENAPEQLREVVERFRLETHAGLWTRCTLCNAMIEKVEKQQVQPLVPPKAYQIYNEFFRCSGCGHLYWRGSHVERILKNLFFVLGKSP